MGTYESLFEKKETQKNRDLSTAKSDWITGHADSTGRQTKNFI